MKIPNYLMTLNTSVAQRKLEKLQIAELKSYSIFYFIYTFMGSFLAFFISLTLDSLVIANNETMATRLFILNITFLSLFGLNIIVLKLISYLGIPIKTSLPIHFNQQRSIFIVGVIICAALVGYFLAHYIVLY
jgi:hypothetical protein